MELLEAAQVQHAEDAENSLEQQRRASQEKPVV